MKKTNGTYKWIATVAIGIVVTVFGFLYDAQGDKVDTLKTDHEKLIEKNAGAIEKVEDTVTDVQFGQVEIKAKLVHLDEKIDLLLKANGVPDYLIRRVNSDSADSQ